VVVSLTPEGRRLIEEVFPEFNKQEKEFVSALNEDEAQFLVELLRKIITHQSD
jgi:DNA-binding MarR family transcriptional regulator